MCRSWLDGVDPSGEVENSGRSFGGICTLDDLQEDRFSLLGGM
ncbi:MAG: hypothetical protein WBB29_17495 [Geitlerinemataceae cyanobacterium]